MHRLRRTFWDSEGTGWLLAVPLGFLLVFLALPLTAVVITAFNELGATGFIDTLRTPIFLEALRRTAIMALIVTAICWPLAVIYSLALAMSSKPVRVFLLVSLLLTFWISILVRAYGWVLIEQPAGVLDKTLSGLGVIDESLTLLGTSAGLYPGMVHVMLPFMVLPIYAALRDLDPAQLRASQSLGSSPLRTLRSVILPALRTGSVAGCTLVFIISLGFFITPAFLGGPDALTVATLIDRQFRVVFDTGSAAAMGTILIVVVLAAYIVVTRLFRIDFKIGIR